MKFFKALFNREIVKLGLILFLTFLLQLIGPIFFADYPIPDAKEYKALVEFFRGQGAFTDAGVIWRGRVLVPLIASIFPFDPLISLRIVNIVFTLFCVVFFYQILSLLKFRNKERFLGIFLFIIAVPTITIGSTPLTDSAGLFFVVFSIYLYLRLDNKPKKFLLIGIILAIGVFSRESVLFIIPVLILWEIIEIGVSKNIIKDIALKILLIGTLPLLSFIFIRILVPKSYLLDQISFSRLLENLTVETFEATTLATIGQLSVILIIGIFGNFTKVIKKSKKLWKLIIGAGGFLPELIMVYLIGPPGNRFFWIYFIFAIPFLLYSFSNLRVKDLKN
ncbi:MAG: phospholipid carrier-dependent glycosyltransferase [Candidatus Lokiarchaeota archaeon]|nr:phospholipid carrier-dependent glycosyltransferase [Candidatus Lokiarchaeota archaeon]